MSIHAQIVESLQDEFGEKILDVVEFRGDTTVYVEPGSIVPVCEFLRDHETYAFNLLAALTAVDYWPEEPRFNVVYQLYSLSNKIFFGLKVPINSDAAQVPTIEKVYPNANWHEREVYDMFGVHFEGHSDMRRILMPEDWEGHPLRKDFPLGYEEIQFSFNFDEIDKRKPYAKE
ncbi:MAG: NADH-quinone oxidoreductase subunit C [Anaerolineales bacterium]|jgi:NADH-quinone oxidoreductase subunit C